ncbi:MAG TPA: PAS domain S-box protein [Terriglobales bacterium]|nr:PAS domain S-box protein [Terriglobales bacterium]
MTPHAGFAVSDETSAVEALRRSEQQYRSVVDNIKQVIFQTDARGVWKFLNAAWTEITGFTVEETLGRNFLSFVHPEDRLRHAEVFQPLLDSDGDYFGHEARYLTKAGDFRWIEVFAQLTTDGDRRVLGIFGTLTDITERKRADEELTATRARLQHLLVSSPAVLYSVPVVSEHAITSISENVARVLGYEVHEVVDDPTFWLSRLHPADAARARTGWAATSVEERGSLQYRLLHRDGRYRWIHDERRLVRDDGGHPVEIVGSWVDVTEHRQSEEARVRLSAVVEQSAEAIVSTNLEGRIEYVNPALEQLTGYTREELVGRSPRILGSDKHDDEFYRMLWATLAAGEAWSGRIMSRRKDGTVFEVEAVVFPVRGADGTVINYVAGMRDVTRQEQIEAELRQAQKMEIAGRLAGGVAHDFNNLITVITGRAQLLLRGKDVTDAQRRDIELIRETANHAAALTRQLLAFSRKQAIVPRVLDLNGVLRTMNKMLRRLIGEDVELVLVPAATLGRVQADPGQIEQVLLNLCINARDAMPGGGRITITTSDVKIGDPAPPRPALPPGEYVVLAVSDTGTGMDEETQAHAFEPFFTTKAVDKGTGLGLSTVYGIVKQSDGDIVIESAPGAGATFRIYLPRVDGTTEDEAPSRLSALPRGTETVLLVEDEDAVRDVAREVLTICGYRVIEARNGHEGLLVGRDHPGRIDLLLTDVVMPQVSGNQLAQQLGALRPPMKILFMSGYTNDTEALRAIAHGEIPLLEKPFTSETLARKVRAVLDGEPQHQP